jgi:hypothetical protein
MPLWTDFSLQSRLPRLLIVAHTLAKVTAAGLPEPEYNESLAPLDHHLLDAFERSGSGTIVLVETFGGRRSYYGYVSADADVDAVADATRARFPAEELSWDVRDDPDWGFLKRYADAYFP